MESYSFGLKRRNTEKISAIRIRVIGCAWKQFIQVMDVAWTKHDLEVSGAESEEQLSNWVMHETLKRVLAGRITEKEAAKATREEVRAEWMITVGS
eukprot:4044437-Pyramimonas_sp.AAC.1